MYRGRPPPRGGYPSPFEGRGRPTPRPYPSHSYREDRSRPRPPYHDHGPPDPYRRSPPRRRYPSPGAGSHRSGDYWAAAPQRQRSPSPRGAGIPLDQNLVITVGNELIGSSSRDHPHRPSYDRSHSRGRSRPRSRSRDRSLDHSRAKSRGRSKSRARSQSRSPDRSRGRSRGRSQVRSRSPDRSRAKSRGRSKSRPRSRSRSRSKSRPRSRSRSRGRSRGRSYSQPASHAHSRSRARSHSRSVSSSSSSHSSSGDDDGKSRKEFKELDMARRKKEIEEMLSKPTKSILKKREDSPSPSLMSGDSPRGLEGSNISRVADRLLSAVKGMDPHMLASMMSELRADPQMAQKAGLDAEIAGILDLLGGASGRKAEEKSKDDIDDEEKFLYGDSEEPKFQEAPEPLRQHGFSELYGDVTEEALYGDFSSQNATQGQSYGLPPGASSHLQAGDPHLQKVDMRFQSRPTITPDQNITVQVSNTAFPPATGPLEESDQLAVEEYDKIQDLLKTIGLDLGVADISKMAARTKERLHGNKAPPKTPTRRRHYSSGSSEGSQRSGRRSRSSGSSSSRSRAGSWSSDNGHKKTSPPPEPRSVKETKTGRSDWGVPAPKEQPPQTPDPKTITPHPGVPIAHYAQAQVHGMMPPNYPPPGYGQYGNYMPYMHQQWPPMYPPPGMAMPPQGPRDEYATTTPYEQLYNKPVQPDSGMKGLTKSIAQDNGKGTSKSSERRMSEEQNNESQKQKVLEEREKLKQEREVRMKKKEYLMKELERLRKQQGELLRKKRREKDGHKDPLLSEISHLQEEVMSQISDLRKEHEAAERKCTEIDKVALILGLSASDRPRRTGRMEDQEEQPPPEKKKKRERDLSSEGLQASTTTLKGSSLARASPDEAKPSVTASAPPTAPPPEPFEYYDAGNHWCKNCNVTSGSMFDFFTHLHSKSHRKTQDPYDRPWASTSTKTGKHSSSEEKMTKPAKGSEFLQPVRGFFCLLCSEFFGDAICAEEHVTTHAHNEKYKKRMYENPLYEQRRNLDRQAGLALEASGKKRKHEDEERISKEKEEKSKHKKDKKDKEKKKEEDGRKEEKSKLKKEEEEEDKPKPSWKEEDTKSAKSEEEERSVLSKKDDEEKHKYRKDDKNRYSREEEEERAKYSKRDEEERYKYSREDEYRYRNRREEEEKFRSGRGDDRFKHGWRDDEEKYKYGKYTESRFKYERERDEGKPKAEKEVRPFKKPEQLKEEEKLEARKQQPGLLPKPYDLPKVHCGPSPAMRAKLRKQSIETGKAAPAPAPAASSATFGKFTWKRKENVLAKEAERVAAEFLKDDEVATPQTQVSVEDSFAKSVAVAKEIAMKLSSQNTMAPPWVAQAANRGRIRPNLPAPAAVLRKTAMMAKPAPLNTFLSIRPQNTSMPGPPTPDRPLVPETVTMTFGCQDVPLETMPEVVQQATPTETMIKKQATPTETMIKKQATPTETMIKKQATPTETMIKIESDVAAPGVPESEQTRTVFVKPPPFMNTGDGAHRSEKLKTNLAAAKAQDLFDIFYSSIGQQGPSAITKSATDTGSKKSQSAAPQTTNPKPAPQPRPQTLHHMAPDAKPNQPPLQIQPKPVPQTEPVQSLLAPQPTPIQPKPSPQAQSQPAKRQIQPSPVKCELAQSQLAPQTELTKPKPTPDAQPQPQSQPKLSPQMEPQPAPQVQPQPQPVQSRPAPQIEPVELKPILETKPQPESQPKLSPQMEPQPAPQVQPQPVQSRPAPQIEPVELKPILETKPQPESQPKLSPQMEPQPAPQVQPQPVQSRPAPQIEPVELKPILETKPQPESQPKLSPQMEPQPAPQVQPQPVQSRPAPQIEPVELKPILETKPQPESQPKLSPQMEPQPAPQVQPQPVQSRPAPQIEPVELKPILETKPQPESQPKLSPQMEPQPAPQVQPEPQPAPDTQLQFLPETYLVPLDPVTKPEPQPSPKTKTKTKTSPCKKTTPRPIRQTRSQTRYQTRQQRLQLSQSDIELDSEATEPETEHGAESQPEDATPGEVTPGEVTPGEVTPGEVMPLEAPSNLEMPDEPTPITPETLGLPSDMMSLGFEYDFSFE